MDSSESTGLTQGTGQGKEAWHDVPYLALFLPFKSLGTSLPGQSSWQVAEDTEQCFLPGLPSTSGCHCV